MKGGSWVAHAAAMSKNEVNFLYYITTLQEYCTSRTLAAFMMDTVTRGSVPSNVVKGSVVTVHEVKSMEYRE